MTRIDAVSVPSAPVALRPREEEPVDRRPAVETVIDEAVKAAAQSHALEMAADSRAREIAARLAGEAPRPDAKLEVVDDADAGLFVYRTVDRRTGEVLRQWPIEEVLRLRSYLRELEGLIVDQRV